MAEGKKSFIMYTNWRFVFDSVPDEIAGRLIKHIFSYVNDEDPQTDDLVLIASFANIKGQLKEDLKHWEETRDKRSLAGKASGRARGKQKEQVLTHDNNSQHKLTVNVNDNVYKEEYRKLVKFLNEALGKNHRVTFSLPFRQFRKRREEGFTSEDFAKAINNIKVDKWHNEHSYTHATPKFITNPDNLDKWINGQTSEQKDSKQPVETEADKARRLGGML